MRPRDSDFIEQISSTNRTHAPFHSKARPGRPLVCSLTIEPGTPRVPTTLGHLTIIGRSPDRHLIPRPIGSTNLQLVRPVHRGRSGWGRHPARGGALHVIRTLCTWVFDPDRWADV